ncbi:MAG: glycoside hydrolase family 95 protein, partial [Clostridia bacterium]|nr:glycoside hydrolase family 95 protein [Clostridia bacterium]
GVDWEKQALPIGNGYMGGMIFGMPGKDQIQFNEETFWAAGYKGSQTSNASSWSSYVTKWKNGTDLSASAIQYAVGLNSSMGEGINGYMNAGNIFVDFGMASGAVVNNYYRDLNLDEGVAHVQYQYDGVTYKREYFASYPDQVMVFRYTADTNNALSFTVNPISAHPGDITVSNGEITITGNLKDSEPYSSGGNAAWACTSDLEYCTKVKVIVDGGTTTDGYGNVKVSNANSVTIIVTAATDYDPDQFVVNSDGSATVADKQYKSKLGVQYAINKANARLSNTTDETYEEMKAKHISDYQNLFGRVKFSLTDDSEICQTPTDTLRSTYASVVSASYTGDDENTASTITKTSETAYNGLDKHLEELFYNYGRYLLISSSRETSLPANLQGKWCQSVAEIWGSCYCININMEMNYWMAGTANLFESGKALIEWFKSQIPAGRITAKNGYGITPKDVNGNASTEDRDDVFIMHTKEAINGTTDMTGSASIQSPGNTAFMMQNLWDLYLTSGDTEYLANEIYPIMRKSANFYTQYMSQFKITTTDTVNYPDGYYYTSGASRSPENGPYELGVKYDLQLIAGLFDYCIEAANILGIDEDKVKQWKEIRNHIQMPIEIGGDGEVKEWASEVSYNTDSSGNAMGYQYHRHISHLVGLYPGNLISRDTPDWLNGARVVLEKRGDNGKGWSCSFKVLLRARTLDGDGALEMLRFQLAQKVYGNLFDFHTPFQIDGNLGSTAGIMEMLMQSQTGPIYLLPALPAAWNKGSISGIKAKNGATVDIKWDENKLLSAQITPIKDGNLEIGYDIEKKNLKVTDENGRMAVLEGNNGIYTLTDAVSGMTYTVTTTDEEPTEVKEDYEIKSIETADNGYSVVVTKNNSIDSTGNVLLVASYDENNEMISLEIIDLSESIVGDNQYNVNVTSGSFVRAFVWSDMNTIKPLIISKKV